MFFRKIAGLAVAAFSALAGIGVTNTAEALQVAVPDIIRGPREVPFTLYHPTNKRSSRRHGNPSCKASTCARNACKYGVQQYAGKDFISYAEHDLRTREDMLSRAAFG